MPNPVNNKKNQKNQRLHNYAPPRGIVVRSLFFLFFLLFTGFGHYCLWFGLVSLVIYRLFQLPTSSLQPPPSHPPHFLSLEGKQAGRKEDRSRDKWRKASQTVCDILINKLRLKGKSLLNKLSLKGNSLPNKLMCKGHLH